MESYSQLNKSEPYIFVTVTSLTRMRFRVLASAARNDYMLQGTTELTCQRMLIDINTWRGK